MYVTVFGDRRGTLPAGWTKETIVALVGDARIDATAPSGPGATLTFLGLAGDAVVRVRPGSRVTGGGLSVFGDRKIEVSPGDGPEIRIDGFSLFGDVEVSDRPLLVTPLIALDRSRGRRLAQACGRSGIAAWRTTTHSIVVAFGPRGLRERGIARR
jgi:hypothetical protein